MKRTSTLKRKTPLRAKVKPRKRRKPMKRRSPLATLRRKCDTLWSKDVRLRANNRCVFCGRSAHAGFLLNAHHLRAKGKQPHLRYEIENGLCLCVRCHKWEPWAPHQSQEQFEAKLRECCPSRYAWYIDHAQDVGKGGGPSQAMLEDLQAIYDKDKQYDDMMRAAGASAPWLKENDDGQDKQIRG